MRFLKPFLVFTHLALTMIASSASPRRVAIVGAGAAGSSAAYFIQEELLAHGEQPAEIHVFERSNLVGGRARVGTVEYNNRTLYFEQGASMFISKNFHLMEMTSKFNLTLCQHPCTYAKGDGGHTTAKLLESSLGSYGIWDPEDLRGSGRWIVGPGNNWRLLDALKALWRYSGPGDYSHVQKRTRTAVDEFLQSYKVFNDTSTIYSTWEEYLSDKPLLQSSLYYSAYEYYLSAKEGVRRKFLEEVVSLATRVNYMQDIDKVNSLGAHISMAAGSDAAYSIAGGNYQIFDRMLASSASHLHLNTSIAEIQRSNKTTGTYTVLTRSNDVYDEFDSVIIAAPLSLANISVIENKYQDHTEYVHMYVTFAIGTLRNDLFPKGKIPRLVVTPYKTTKPFNCLSILACLGSEELNSSRQCRDGPVLVKMFSHKRIDLEKIFAKVEWHHEQEWHSYPKLKPLNAGFVQQDPQSTAYYLHRSLPPPIILDRRDSNNGVYYINGMEALFSTMESQTVAAKNVIRLALFGTPNSTI
ncbi:hypothetical protein IWW36_001896 [Coemansia brasiliensis]|uniref:Prenylcysteine lyase domain-containing protein n=1 Tax=Coemansia brasiliensis TaxID=2650707 RepID=A0A9W8IEK6_9FUNG|nr:hypothetical protein IWW36_001896 [Coemansia brasiliensis]